MLSITSLAKEKHYGTCCSSGYKVMLSCLLFLFDCMNLELYHSYRHQERGSCPAWQLANTIFCLRNKSICPTTWASVLTSWIFYGRSAWCPCVYFKKKLLIVFFERKSSSMLVRSATAIAVRLKDGEIIYASLNIVLLLLVHSRTHVEAEF